MTLKFHPDIGTILLCNFNTGFKPPEMVKVRPVIVVSPRLKKRDGLCTVVPLSTTQPDFVQPFHGKLVLDRPLPAPWDVETQWVKADMIATVSFERLQLIGIGRDQEGKRKYLNIKINSGDLEMVKNCVLHGLGMSHLTSAS